MRNHTIDICKAFAIILMVIGHTEYPLLLTFIYEFHMPLFFITAGYFFQTKYLTAEADFVKKRLRGLYLPFLKWSLVFLCLHNLMFKVGVLNEVYGNYQGGVTHPYTWHQFQQRVWSSVFNMSGYDEFLTGAFWFFRALFVASIAYLVLYKLLYKVKWMRGNPIRIGVTICVIALLVAMWQTGEGLRVTGLMQGGYRDIMGTFFFGVGYLFRQRPRWLNIPWWSAALCLGIVLAAAHWFPAGMTFRASLQKCLRLPIPAIAGFVMTYWLSAKINHTQGALKRFLVFCGENTLPVYIFHIISFKVVSLLKIAYYGLDYRMVGCHMIVHYDKRDAFWLLYTLAGVGIPLIGVIIRKKTKNFLLNQ